MVARFALSLPIATKPCARLICVAVTTVSVVARPIDRYADVRLLNAYFAMPISWRDLSLASPERLVL